MLKNNDEDKYLEAEQQVEAEIQRRVTNKSNGSFFKTKKNAAKSDKLDFPFLGLGGYHD